MKIFKISVRVSTSRIYSEIKSVLDVYGDDDASEHDIFKAKEKVAKKWVDTEVYWDWKDENIMPKD